MAPETSERITEEKTPQALSSRAVEVAKGLWVGEPATVEELVAFTQLMYRIYCTEKIIPPNLSRTYCRKELNQPGVCQVGVCRIRSNKDVQPEFPDWDVVGHAAIIPDYTSLSDEESFDLPADKEPLFHEAINKFRRKLCHAISPAGYDARQPTFWEGTGFCIQDDALGDLRGPERIGIIAVLIEQLFRWVRRRGGKYLFNVYHPHHEGFWKRMGYERLAEVETSGYLKPTGDSGAGFTPPPGILGVRCIEGVESRDIPIKKRELDMVHTPVGFFLPRIREGVMTRLVQLTKAQSPDEVARIQSYLESEHDVPESVWNNRLVETQGTR